MIIRIIKSTKEFVKGELLNFQEDLAYKLINEGLAEKFNYDNFKYQNRMVYQLKTKE